MKGDITIETIARSWRDDVAHHRAFSRGAAHTKRSEVEFDALMAFVADEVLGPEECQYAYRSWQTDERGGIIIEARCLTHSDEPPRARWISYPALWELASPPPDDTGAPSDG